MKAGFIIENFEGGVDLDGKVHAAFFFDGYFEMVKRFADVPGVRVR